MKKYLSWSLALLFALLSAGKSPAVAAPPGAPPRPPNIIFILADDLGYGDLGCYGQSRILTPNLDQLAAQGMRFTDAYAGSTVCAPSRATLMTGLHTGHAGIRGNSNLALTSEERTVADVLHEAGYRTGLIGKWGLGNHGSSGYPTKKGFDEFAGYTDQTHAHDYYTDHIFRTDPVSGFDGRQELVENRGGKKALYLPDLFTKAAVNFVTSNKPQKYTGNHPFFLCLNYIIPHANNEEAQRTGNGMQVPSDAPYSAESWPQPEKNKAAMITRMDGDIGRLMDRLRQLSLTNDTVIFFSSDNGPHKEGGIDPKFHNSSGPFRGIKRDLTEGGIRIPFIAWWLGTIPAGKVSRQPIAFWDVLPTLAEIAGVTPPKDIDGISFLPTLLGKTQTNQHDFLYWEFHERGFQQAIRAGNWKAIRPQAGERLELYDLSKDPGEKENLAKGETSTVKKMEDFFKVARTESEHFPIKPPPKTEAQNQNDGKEKSSDAAKTAAAPK